ncbi:hypothetical protein ASPWEDRAFT_60276 [Aspergillus wentii DTO 134E9]|uniref:Amino acid permease/ SLC12A domain-containing protein n=1 Tax=Aspergillus wentii DTO 134E9 TaxID=1073089 RepID=A0A1L9RFC1_ASPWE|nr:uncharacterized protein ASPWEDRAFT_60276 [Aspergillus wentii DTO 134E9]OJJ33629.1 hypothetical protein ASPWEDRAFT_60276 [Aspergillus wentii DTO 134E9]
MMKPSIQPGTVQNIQSNDDDDDWILQANGHPSAMPRQFDWLSALGLGFSITNSWIGYLSCFGQNLTYGGAQACIFSLIVAFAIQFLVTIGLAGLGSAYPSSGGQYHFCYILSSSGTRYISYIVGWLSVLGWWIVTCSGISLAALVLNGIVSFSMDDYVAKQWQTYLTYVGVAVVTIIPVFVVSRRISVITQISLFLSFSGYLIFFVVSLAMHKQHQPSSFILQSGQGNSGWSHGTAWMLAVSNAMYAFGGTDGVIHICEEIPKPGRRVPQVVMMTMVIGLVTCLSLFISPLPSIELVYQVTGSGKVTVGLFILLCVIYAMSLPSQWNGMPFSNFFSTIHGTLHFPVYTTIAAFLFSCLYGLLYLASTTAFNSIITSAVLFLNITYTVPQALVLCYGRSSLPKRYLNLGWFGYVCNVFFILWIFIRTVLICMPPGIPVALNSMNYTSVVLVGIFTVINGFWFVTGRQKFEGPRIDWGRLQAS